MSGAVHPLLSYGSPKACDPFYADVSALLHFNGADGSTDIIDETGLTFNVIGDAHLSTAQKQFGNASLFLDNSGGDYVVCTASSVPAFDFGSGSFTIEFWVRPTLSSDGGVVSKRTLDPVGWALEVRASGAVWLRAKIGGVYSDTQVTTSAGVVLPNVWSFVALVRDGNDWVIYVNGINVGSSAIAGVLDNETDIALTIGASTNGSDENQYHGYIDEMRLTKGVARYTEDFTPPTAEFPGPC